MATVGQSYALLMGRTCTVISSLRKHCIVSCAACYEEGSEGFAFMISLVLELHGPMQCWSLPWQRTSTLRSSACSYIINVLHFNS